MTPREPEPRREKEVVFGREVDKKSLYKWETVDKPGTLYYAHKTQLHVDPSYQRVISNVRVAAITASWSWVAAGTLIVAERADHTLWLVDGQQRHAAAMQRSDIAEMPCNVFVSEGLDWEAKAFYRANCMRGNVSAFDKLRAMITAGDRLHIDAVNLMATTDYRPAKDESAYGIRCIARFISFLKSDRGVLERAWPLVCLLHEGVCIKQRVFTALMYIAKYGTEDITVNPWRDRLLHAGIEVIALKIDQRTMVSEKDTGARVQAESVLAVINKGLRDNNKMRLTDATDPQNR